MPSLDIVRVQDVSLSGALDTDILAWAAGQDRVLRTHDRDTMPGFANDRVVAGQPMPGVFLISSTMPKGQAVEDMLLAIACWTPEECRDLVRFFPL
jgi:predicted nuclease of predicted toxin-antitoxin system